MICEPGGPCGARRDHLGLTAPPPGQLRLTRRLGHYDDFVRDLIARAEQRSLTADTGGEAIGRRWDIEGDPQAMSLVELWAYVAEGVAAYSELTAGEGYLATARDWLDLARLADQVGYRPGQRVAAEGWVRFETDRLASPVVPAGTRVQAPGTPTRAPQTFETVAETPLLADWADLTATWVPRPATPTGRKVRFLGDPGFRAGDDVLLIDEQQPGPPSTGWIVFWLWLVGLSNVAAATVTPLAVVTVVGHTSELGTTLVEFDRDVSGLLGNASTSYAAYRILDKASSARRLSSVLRIGSTGNATKVDLPAYAETSAITATSVVLDRELSELSTDSLVAVVRWDTLENQGDVVPVANHVPIEWEVVPGTPVLVSKLRFGADVGSLTGTVGQRDVYVLDRRVATTHYEFPASAPTEAPGSGLQVRVWPAPSTPSPPSGKLAVETAIAGVPTWELLDVTAAAETEADSSTATRPGLILDVQTAAPVGDLDFSPASGNVVRVRHGLTTRAVLGSGDGVTAHGSLSVPDDPIAAELGADGSATDSLRVRVDGRLWAEHPTLFGAGPALAYETRVGPEGGIEVRFGDGDNGAIPPSGVANISGTYRIGGGTEGEVGSGEIDTLLGSIRGVRSVLGAGPTVGGADQPAESALRREAPTRARAMDRIVALGDAADLALAFPGVSHAAVWSGQAPPDVACGPGPMVAVLRRGTSGVRQVLAAELDALRMFLDGRRDVTVPLCVVTGTVVPVTLAVTVAVDAALDPVLVEAEIRAALTDPEGVLAAENRLLGQPLDRSDVLRVVHSVAGVIGVESLTLETGVADSETSTIGRLVAERYELLVTDPPSILVVPA
jgi:predicted phage baseplate assembly protein